MVICGVNSFGVDWFMQEVLPHIPDTTPVLSVTKGLVAYDDGTLISYPEYWERSIAPRKMNLNAVGGPCTSWWRTTRRSSPSAAATCRRSKRCAG